MLINKIRQVVDQTKNGYYMLMNQNTIIEKLTEKFINDKVKTMEDAITGAKYIIAEYISDNANFRKYIRNFIYRNGILKCKKKKND